jgi:hypothetical protein
MLLIVFILVIATTLMLAKHSRSPQIWKFCWINFVVISIYNLIGWLYIIKFLDTGGGSLGPGLLLIFITALHIALLFIVIIVMRMREAVKEQLR